MTQPEIAALHAAYQRLTGLSVTLSTFRVYCWEHWVSRGWTQADLELVIRLIKDKMSKPVQLSCLRFGRLISDVERFEEDLSEARARYRKKVYPKGKAAVLRAIKRPDEPEPDAPRTAAQVLAGKAALADLRKLRDSL